MARKKSLPKQLVRKPNLIRLVWFRFYCIGLIALGAMGLQIQQAEITAIPPSGQAPQTEQAVINPISRPSIPTVLEIDTFINQPIEEQSLSEENMPRVSSDKVSYFAHSARPGENGNMILYGHNLEHILGNLSLTRLGSTVTVKNEDGEVFTYTVTDIAIVEPDETQWLENTQEAVVTIYTCSGWLDSKRLVVRAKQI